MDPNAKALQWRPGQQHLTPEQEEQAKRFAQAYCQDQLSLEPVDEQEVEACLRQAYEAAGLAPPQRIYWLDGPLQLVAAFDPETVGVRVEASVWDSVECPLRDHLKAELWSILGTNLEDSLWASAEASILEGNISTAVWMYVRHKVEVSLGDSQSRSDRDRPEDVLKHKIRYSVGGSVFASVEGYGAAFWLAYYHFLAVSLRLDVLQALGRFNRLVSGYWLGTEVALIVRRTTILALDVAGRLHNANGRCMEYRDGWGFYAWHGMQVPEQVILAPETLTREDFFNESNLEVRRIIQERMGGRFVAELGGRVIDTSLRGTLYEVRLPEDDPEGVARYVQVQDTSTSRQYFLRVPPTVQTATEAVAWTFSRTIEDYHPAQES